ncbi:MAG TPA: hypothetical protein VFN23_00510, partial [Ktedonobacteraceae bacterium]|nr:hypothetical protein [Ktedonobacteraceae bacterium]
MDQKSSHERFLEEDATSEQRERALSLNIQRWFTLSAQSKSREAVYEEGLMWTSGHLVISSINPLHIDDQLDRALQWFRAQQPLDEVICWYATATPPGDLAARLLARGFEPDEQPNWMWCNLRDLPNQRIPSSTFNIQAFEDEPVAQADTLPYYPAKKRNARAIMHRLDPRQVRSLVAFQRGQVVGRC